MNMPITLHQPILHIPDDGALIIAAIITIKITELNNNCNISEHKAKVLPHFIRNNRPIPAKE
jgi:hypothetical protein